MVFVFEQRGGRQIEDAAQRVTDAHRAGRVAGRSIPHAEQVLLYGRMRMSEWLAQLRTKRALSLTGYRVDSTMPHTSGPTRNCSPSIAIHTLSQARSILFFRSRITHLPPSAFVGSSHMGLMPLLNRCSSRYGFIDDGRTR